MKLSDIAKLKPADIRRMPKEQIKDAIKTAQYEQARRFKRMEKAGVASKSPLYRGVEEQLTDKGITGPVSKNFKLLHNSKSNDIDVLRNELRSMIDIITRGSSTVSGTKELIQKEFERIFKDSDEYEDPEYREWWRSSGQEAFWSAYNEAKSYGLTAYGSNEVQTMIAEYYSAYNKFPDPATLQNIFWRFGSTSEFRRHRKMRKDMEDEEFTDLY